MVRIRGLGRLLKVEPQCYAAFLGGCSAEMSNEHPLSQGLRPNGGLHAVFSRQRPGEEDWRRELAATFAIEDAAAPVLCRTHNRKLSAG